MIPLREYAVKIELPPVDSHNWGQCLLHGWLQVRHNQKSDEPEYPIHVRIRSEYGDVQRKEKWTWFAANWTMVGLSEGWVVNSPSRAWGQGCRICVSVSALLPGTFFWPGTFTWFYTILCYLCVIFFSSCKRRKNTNLGGLFASWSESRHFVQTHTKLIKLYKIYAEIITISP